MQMIIKQSNMSTRAIIFLKRQNAAFDVVKYDHDRKGAAFAAQVLGFPLERTVKTLVIALGEKQHTLALMPGDRELDLKRMAKACKTKRAGMASPATAERLTGYKVGGISPFGLTSPLPSVMDSRLLDYDCILINGGQRGTMLEMSPKDIARLLESTIADIARW
jgi:Cys-tRNA(Pro)/Cys-tRNA(Cys) deacylase